MIIRLRLAFLIGAVTSAPAPAQDIVVTGRGLRERAGDAAFSIVTIDRARIEMSASDRLESVLADIAGLQQFRRSDSRSANPTSQGISLRGIGGNASSRALLILDGVPQADPFGGWIPFPAYATDRIDSIRVTRGGGSGYLGPGALAGTVEIDSRPPDRSAPITSGLALGSRDAVEAQGTAGLVRDGGFATLSAAFARGDGFIPTVAANRGPADRPAPYRQASAAFRGVVALSPTTELQANLSGFTDRRERGTAFTENRSQGADASVRLVGRGSLRWSALAYVQTRDFASSFAAVNAGRTAATQTLDQFSTPATGIGARAEIAPVLGDGLDLRLGGDVRSVAGRTQELFTFVAGSPTRIRRAGGETRTAGLFLDASKTLGDVTVTGGGRLDWWRISDGFLDERTLGTGAPITDARFPDRRGTEATGRIGAAWTPAGAVTLRVAAYRGWRLPTLNELYRPFRVGADATAANAGLAPERLEGVEGGVALTPIQGVTLGATLFRNTLDGAIANVSAGRGPGLFPGVGFVAAGGVYRVRQNLDAIRATGLELDADWRSGAVSGRASWSHISSRVRASGAAAALAGLRPAQTPRDSLSLGLSWQDDGHTAAATLRHVSRQFDDDQNSRSLRAATTLDAYAATPIARGLKLEARAENLFDARVEAGISGANIVERATPRTIWIGLKYQGG